MTNEWYMENVGDSSNLEHYVLKLMLYFVSLTGEMNQKYKELKKREENMDSKWILINNENIIFSGSYSFIPNQRSHFGKI